MGLISLAKTSEWMEGSMPVGNNSTIAKPGSRLRELGLVLPKPPSPLGAYVEASQVGSLLFLSGTLREPRSGPQRRRKEKLNPKFSKTVPLLGSAGVSYPYPSPGYSPPGFA